jgi:hypothetical protein
LLLVGCLEREGFYLEKKEVALYEIWLKKGMVAFKGDFLCCANLLGRLELMKQDKIQELIDRVWRDEQKSGQNKKKNIFDQTHKLLLNEDLANT